MKVESAVSRTDPEDWLMVVVPELRDPPKLVVPEPLKLKNVGVNVPPLITTVALAPTIFQVEAVAVLKTGVGRPPFIMLRFPGKEKEVVEAISHV